MASISRGSEEQDLPRHEGVGTGNDDGTGVGGRSAREFLMVKKTGGCDD